MSKRKRAAPAPEKKKKEKKAPKLLAESLRQWIDNNPDIYEDDADIEKIDLNGLLEIVKQWDANSKTSAPFDSVITSIKDVWSDKTWESTFVEWIDDYFDTTDPKCRENEGCQSMYDLLSAMFRPVRE